MRYNRPRLVRGSGDLLGEKAKAVTRPAIDGIIKEANEVAGEIENEAVLDAALIASAQAVEHYEITRYGTPIAWAEQLERPEIVSRRSGIINSSPALLRGTASG